MLQFLTQELPNISSYSSLNTMRSAISLLSYNDIGNHPIIKRFCKGVAALKLPQLRYDYMWDPAPVIASLSSIYPYDSVSLKVITKKLVLLLALGTGLRSKSLSSLSFSQISLNEKLIIRIPDRIKRSTLGCSRPFFCFSRFENHENLCIVLLIEHYINMTKELRPPTCDFLFISYNEPFGAVTTQTVRRWIKQGLEECGVDTTALSARNTRRASTSRTEEDRVAMNLIKHATGWTGESRVFANFYNRPIINPQDFINTIRLS